MKNLIAAIVIALAPMLSFGQDYVVTIQGDTLKGNVKISSIEPIDQVQVIVNGKKIKLNAVKARSVLHGGERYQSVRYGRTQKFMKVIASGYLSLFSFIPPGQGRFDGLLLSKKNGQSMDVPNLGFKKTMAVFLQECEEVSNEVKNEKLQRGDLMRIIEEFNLCINTTFRVSGSNPAFSASMAEKLAAINNFKRRIDSLETFTAKKDVLDILHDIEEKLENQDIIPSYLYGVLKTHLANQPTVIEDLDKLIAMLSKK